MILIAMAGLPASGKSVLAEQIAAALPAIILDKDKMRAALFPPSEIEYSLQQDDFCFDILLQVAGYLLQKGRNVILDGRPFAYRYQMDGVVKFVFKNQVALKVIECTCSDESFQRRLEQDVMEGRHLAANRSFEMFLDMRAKADPLVVPRLVVDTDQPIQECLTVSLDYIEHSPEFAALKDMAEKLSTSAQRVQDTLSGLGYQNRVIEHAQTTRSAREAAQAIGCSVAQIVKSLIFRTKDSHRPVLVLASGPNRVNEVRLGELVMEAIERADPDFVQSVTGFAIGGVPPVGHHTPMATFIDEDLMHFGEIWAAAGTPNAVFKLTPADMAAMTHGQVVSIK